MPPIYSLTKASNDFAIKASDGTIRTYFKPGRGQMVLTIFIGRNKTKEIILYGKI